MADIDPSWTDTGAKFILTPEIELEAKDAISRYQSHLKFYGVNPTVENTREGDLYKTKLGAHDGYTRSQFTGEGVSDVCADFALLLALEDFYHNYYNRR